jgi:hypothetical protein
LCDRISEAVGTRVRLGAGGAAPHPIGVQRAQVEPVEELHEQEDSIAADEQPDGNTLFEVALLARLVVACDRLDNPALIVWIGCDCH